MGDRGNGDSRTNAEDQLKRPPTTDKELTAMSFKVIAKPALNKTGYAKLTFKGFEEVEPQFDATSGEQIKRGYVKLMFEIMDTTRKAPISANIIGGALTGNFLTALTALGFMLPEPITTADDDGFEVEVASTVDDDGFETDDTDSTQLIEELKEYLTKAKSKVLLSKVSKGKRGYWEIDVDSLKPLAS